MPVALTIAGSDPSGGAGIQSDLRTFAALDVVGLSVITALTVQNSRGVLAIHPVAPDVLAAQLNAILEDSRPDAVKIGMLGGASQVRVVADALRRFRPPHVVLDPVLASTGGVPLLDREGHEALLTDLLPLCDLVTPNLDEAAALANLTACAMLTKGGHRTGAPVDVLTRLDGTVTTFLGERIDTPHTHGTGCLLSSAIAAWLARGLNLENAVFEAKQWLEAALDTPVAVGQGRGYPDVLQAKDTLTRQHYMGLLACLNGVYVVTDPGLRPDRTHEQIIRAAREGGARAIQLRDKATSLRSLVREAQRLRAMPSTAHRSVFLVNDRVDVALASGADGVHLGPDDISPKDARFIMGPDKIIGVSTGTLEEAEAAAPYASYFGVGAVFGSKTKLDAGAPVGLGRIREIKAAFPHIPIVAIGGIHADNIGDVARAGADAAAVVSAVVAAPDMAAATRALVRLFAEGKATPPAR